MYRQSLYKSLDPYSIAESLAFYELYPETKEGRQALAKAEALLGGQCPITGVTEASQKGMRALLAVVNRDMASAELALSDEELLFIEKLGADLPNRKLKGHLATTEEEVIALPSEEIDLGRALLLSQVGALSTEIRTYEAILDLMVLQVRATLASDCSNRDKVRALNKFIFEKMRFRFPPHSVYAKDVDLYTFLPSVLDNHLGVCLGVTALYLSLAQRLNLPLEVITPPGHIFVRYRDESGIVNIETTARGVHLPTETYLSVNQASLKQRTLKEVIGMTHFNQASVFLHRQDFEKAVRSYEKALPYMQGDPLLQELLGFSSLFIGQKERGEELLREVAGKIPEGALVAESRPLDYLNGNVGIEGLEAIFLEVNEERDSILQKIAALSDVLNKYPLFRDGWVQLAVSYLQLNRQKEALSALRKYHEIDPHDPTVEYYLAVLCGEREDFPHAWEHFKNAERIVSEKNYMPKALKELRRNLAAAFPAG